MSKIWTALICFAATSALLFDHVKAESELQFRDSSELIKFELSQLQTDFALAKKALDRRYDTDEAKNMVIQTILDRYLFSAMIDREEIIGDQTRQGVMSVRLLAKKIYLAHLEGYKVVVKELKDAVAEMKVLNKSEVIISQALTATVRRMRNRIENYRDLLTKLGRN